MGHKTRADRQREAQERINTVQVPSVLASLRDAMDKLREWGPALRTDSRSSMYLITNFRCRAKRLYRLWLQVDGPVEAKGRLRTVLAGRDPYNDWVSGPGDSDDDIIDKWLEALRK